MKIVVVEDDHLQARFLIERLHSREAFPDADIRCVRTEEEFRRLVDDFENLPPDVFVMDVMLRWTDPCEEPEPPPDDVRRDGYATAGLRCQLLLASRKVASKIPIVLYTVVESADIEDRIQAASNQRVVYLPKETDWTKLVSQIRLLTR